MENKIITQLTFNWFYTPEGEGFDTVTVGKEFQGRTCIKIIEHLPMGEGDRLWYDAGYSDGTILRIFNPNTVTFIDQ